LNLFSASPLRYALCSKKRLTPQTEEEIMKKQLFIVSFCYRGLPGGEIIADHQAVTYKTGKLTIPSEYRNLEMKYTDIAYVYRDKATFLPAISVHMKNGSNYKFVFFFGRKKFFELMKSQGIAVNS
jgi:hypothetical protein